jgi:hypothetical protein
MGSELRGLEADLWRIRAGSYSTRGYCSRQGLWRRLGLEGRRECRPRGFAHGRQERRVFLLITCLIWSIRLLSLNREDYLTSKEGLDLIPKSNLNGSPGPLNPWHLTKTYHFLRHMLLPIIHHLHCCTNSKYRCAPMPHLCSLHPSIDSVCKLSSPKLEHWCNSPGALSWKISYGQR